MKLLLDTNMCIYIMNHRPAHVVQKFREYSLGEIGVTAITVAELHFGVEKSQQPERNLDTLIRFLSPLRMVPFSTEAAVHYGKTKAKLRAEGRMIGELDCLIAAIAVAHNLPLVTNNTSEFERVPRLQLWNWSPAE